MSKFGGSRRLRPSGGRWQKLRKFVLMEEPLCRKCTERGIVKETEEVDHIVPLANGGTNCRANLQGLCADCHEEKTLRENYGKVPGCNETGQPKDKEHHWNKEQ